MMPPALLPRAEVHPLVPVVRLPPGENAATTMALAELVVIEGAVAVVALVPVVAAGVPLCERVVGIPANSINQTSPKKTGLSQVTVIVGVVPPTILVATHIS